MKNWEVAVRDETDRVQTFTYPAFDEAEAKQEFRDRARWTAKKLRQRLVHCKVAV